VHSDPPINVINININIIIIVVIIVIGWCDQKYEHSCFHDHPQRRVMLRLSLG